MMNSVVRSIYVLGYHDLYASTSVIEIVITVVEIQKNRLAVNNENPGNLTCMDLVTEFSRQCFSYKILYIIEYINLKLHYMM